MTNAVDPNLITYKPIGFLSCNQKNPVDSPRQGVLAEKSEGIIALNREIPVEALRDLCGFSRIWIVYDFHFNKDWNPLVRPPRGSDTKRGIFATRSPYRPNSIGLSCVQLDKIVDRSIFISGHDLLDGTPILDIKPYLPYAESFPEAKMGWLEELKKTPLLFSESVMPKLLWLEEKLAINLGEIIKNQLEFEPTSNRSKRVSSVEDYYIFSYKTWRIQFHIESEKILVTNIWSGYSTAELSASADPYFDKELHRNFLSQFSI